MPAAKWGPGRTAAKPSSFISEFLNFETSDRVMPAASAARPAVAATRDPTAVREIGEQSRLSKGLLKKSEMH